MIRHAAAIFALTCLGAASAAELQVNVYEGLECEDSEKVKPGDYLSMHYTGTIDESSPSGEKGEKFDSSRDRDSTFDFTIGVGQVIKGWDEGIVGLCKGAKATLIVPSEYGYGEVGAGDKIPGGATLNFDVEVVDITDPPERPPTPNIFKQIDTDGDQKLSLEEITAYFKTMDKDVPDGLMDSEDKDGDGFVSWDEFSGPKGDSPGGDEL
mmetsp:Transcript_4138/g.9395  ORF Transcript_4138/g.9395 Transcript_4138/m.9395 type:complete len:210 (+) Transcript_4138:76-705(+)